MFNETEQFNSYWFPISSHVLVLWIFILPESKVPLHFICLFSLLEMLFFMKTLSSSTTCLPLLKSRCYNALIIYRTQNKLLRSSVFLRCTRLSTEFRKNGQRAIFFVVQHLLSKAVGSQPGGATVLSWGLPPRLEEMLQFQS